MVIANFGNTYLTYAGGTATWESEVTYLGNKNRPSYQGTATSSPAYSIAMSPSVRTQPHPNDPAWDALEALLATSEIPDVSLAEDDAWLDDIRSNWRGSWETVDDESS